MGEQQQMTTTMYSEEAIHDAIDRIVRRTFQMDFPWDWPAGVAFYGVSRALEATGNASYLEWLVEWVDKQLDNGLPNWTINTMAVGHTLLTLYQQTQDEKYLAVATEMADYLQRDATRFGEGIFQHTVSQSYNFPEQAWVDTMFMAGYFLVRIGSMTGNSEYTNDGLLQYHGHEKLLQDAKTNLFYHGWDNLAQHHMSGIFWARGNSWAAYTMTRALRYIPVTNPSYMQIMDSVRDQLAALVRLQEDNGLWHTVLNDREAYLETSGSAGIAASLVEFNHAVGSALYNSYIQKSIPGLLAAIAEDGTVTQVSAGTAVMDDADGYKQVPAKRIQGWGQGLMLSFLASVLTSKH